MRYIRFHWPLLAAGVVCILLLCTAFFEPPRELLQDMAMELEAGQFICEDGTIWQISDKPNYSKYTQVRKIGETDPERIKHEFGNKVTGPLSPVEYAQRVNSYGYVWVDSDGGVWSLAFSEYGHRVKSDDPNSLNLVPFFKFEEEKAELTEEIPFEMKRNRLSFELILDNEEEYSDFYYTLSLLFEDGWRVVAKDTAYYYKETVRTGWQDYQFENGNTTQIPVFEESHYCRGSLENCGSITSTPGSYCLKVYAHKDEKVVQLAEYDMTTEIKGKTLYINETAAG